MRCHDILSLPCSFPSCLTPILDIQAEAGQGGKDPSFQKLGQDVGHAGVQSIFQIKLSKLLTAIPRIRRVKCDESKPECLRCVKFGGEHFCDGYDSQEKERKPSTSGNLAPRLLKAQTSEIVVGEDKFQCLRFYVEQTATELSGILGGGFWPQLLLQAGQEQPFIQNAIITIGALSKILKIGGVRAESSFAPRMGMTEEEVVLQQHYLFALQEYHKFIRGTRAHLSVHEDDKRVVLVSCLLITCIERLQNHNQSALTQARNGLKIMQEWIEEHASSEISDQGRLAERGYTITSVPGLLSPQPLVVEDEIIEQFRRLELSSLMMDTGNLTRKRKFDRDEEAALGIMPPAFQDIKDAGLYFDLILGRAYHFIREAQQVMKHMKPVICVSFSDEENPFVEDSNHSVLAQMSLDDLDEQAQKHAAVNQRWDDAFQHLFRHLNKSLSESHPDLLCATLLRIRSISLSIRLAGATTATEMVYDDFLPDFKKIMSLARPLVENSKNFTDGSFCFDQGFIFELLQVALRCRDRETRRAAFELLESKDWREGTWGSRRVASGARFCMEIEEDCSKAGFIPESARARVVSIAVDVEKRSAFVQYLQGVGADAVLKSSVRDWSTFY